MFYAHIFNIKSDFKQNCTKQPTLLFAKKFLAFRQMLFIVLEITNKKFLIGCWRISTRQNVVSRA